MPHEAHPGRLLRRRRFLRRVMMFDVLAFAWLPFWLIGDSSSLPAHGVAAALLLFVAVFPFLLFWPYIELVQIHKKLVPFLRDGTVRCRRCGDVLDAEQEAPACAGCGHTAHLSDTRRWWGRFRYAILLVDTAEGESSDDGIAKETPGSSAR